MRKTIAILVLFLLILGCSAPETQVPGATSSKGSAGPVKENALVLEIQKLETSTPAIETFTLDLLMDAYNAGELSEEEYALQSAYNLFEPEKLDAKFKTDSTVVDHPTFTLMKIAHEFDSYSSETQSKLEKYILSSDDPNSYFYNDEPSEEVN